MLGCVDSVLPRAAVVVPAGGLFSAGSGPVGDRQPVVHVWLYSGYNSTAIRMGATGLSCWSLCPMLLPLATADCPGIGRGSAMDCLECMLDVA